MPSAGAAGEQAAARAAASRAVAAEPRIAASAGDEYVLVRPSPPRGAGEKPAETVLADLDLASQVALRARQRAERMAAAAEQGPSTPTAAAPAVAVPPAITAEGADEAPAVAPGQQATATAAAAAAASGVPSAAGGGVRSGKGEMQTRGWPRPAWAVSPSTSLTCCSAANADRCTF